jgi:two-component system alkaline phosphatase synthesis response regulator PhoP
VIKILVVEDEPGIAFGLESDLQTEGYSVVVVTDGAEANRRAQAEQFDLILLDVMLPTMDGLEVCRELRHAGVMTPIILLTSKAQEAEKILGLDMGADDYVTKPFSPRELRARIRSQLRRSGRDDGEKDSLTDKELYRFGDFELDLARMELRRVGDVVLTTSTEFKLLAAFLRNRGRVMTREQLLDEVWGRGIAVTDRVIDNYVVSLRRKIEENPSEPRHLQSVRGIGYRFDA